MLFFVKENYFFDLTKVFPMVGMEIELDLEPVLAAASGRGNGCARGVCARGGRGCACSVKTATGVGGSICGLVCVRRWAHPGAEQGRGGREQRHGSKRDGADEAVVLRRSTD